MPQHIAPHIRALEEALESAGLIQKLDSDAVAKAKVDEAAGRIVKVVPVAHTRIVNGKSITAS